MKINADYLFYWRQIADSVLAYQLCLPLGPALDSAASSDEAAQAVRAYCRQESCHPSTCLCVVQDSGNPVGWWALDEHAPRRRGSVVRDGMRPISPTQVIPAGLSFHDLVLAFSERRKDEFFLLRDDDGDQLMGTVYYECVGHALARVCWFALVTELEEVGLSLCQCFAEECWTSLSYGKRRKAKGMLEEHLKDHKDSPLLIDSSAAMLRFTAFGDKGELIATCRLLHDWEPGEVHRLWEVATKLRNVCAHGESAKSVETVLPRERITGFLADCGRLLESMNTVMPH